MRSVAPAPASTSVRSTRSRSSASTGPTKTSATRRDARRFGHQQRVRLLDVRRRTPLGARQVSRSQAGGVEAALQLVDLPVEDPSLALRDEAAARDADADEDADDEREEHRGERGDVVAEVEHRLRPWRRSVQGGRGLHELVEPVRRHPWQRARPPERLGPPGALDRHGDERSIGRERAASRTSTSSRSAVRLHTTRSCSSIVFTIARPVAPRLAEQRGRRRARDLPPGALAKAARVGPDRRDGRPPVGEMVGLGEEAPDVGAGGEHLVGRLGPHAAASSGCCSLARSRLPCVRPCPVCSQRGGGWEHLGRAARAGRALSGRGRRLSRCRRLREQALAEQLDEAPQVRRRDDRHDDRRQPGSRERRRAATRRPAR